MTYTPLLPKKEHGGPIIAMTTAESYWRLVISSSFVTTAAAAAATPPPPPPNLNGAHLRITVLEERGFLDVTEEEDVDRDDRDDGRAGRRLSFSGYLIDVLSAVSREDRANFTYALLTPSGYGSMCSPLLDDDVGVDVSNTNHSSPSAAAAAAAAEAPYGEAYRTQYNCGAGDVNDLPRSHRAATDAYLGMYYVTPARQLENRFTIPFVPPFSGTLAMFGTATGVPNFEALVEQQRTGLQPTACAPDGTALIEFVRNSYPGLLVRGVLGGEEEIYRSFLDGSCEIFITDGPLAASFVLRRSLLGECFARDGSPIGVIGEPMQFGLSHYAIGVRLDIPTEVVDTLSYWMNVLMTCNPLDQDGPCPEGNLATFYEGRGGTGSECGYVLFPAENDSLLSAGAIAGIVISAVAFVIVLYTAWHCHRIKRQRRLYAKRSRAAAIQIERERELHEFIAHEVRNPLSSAIAALSFVSCKANDPALIPSDHSRASLRSDIAVIDASLQFVSELLRNMLDLHRTANKQMKLELTPADLLRDVLEPVASVLFMRGTKVEVITECPNNLIIKTDRMRLKQIVLNLAANSSKFVEEGYIRLRADVVSHSVQVHVEDSGPGIPRDKRDRLFAKFQESLDRLNQGTGIGLCVCKNLSELLGADLFLDDTFDSGIPGYTGTRFTLRLNQEPLSIIENGFGGMDELAKEELSLNGTNDDLPEAVSVLFVDDDMVIRKMFTRSLARVAPTWNIQEASNGETALRLVDDETFDIIFMDQYMASVEKQWLGTETVQLLRAKGVESIICGLSANDTRVQFLDAGANAFWLKPFPCSKEALKSELLLLLDTKKLHHGDS